MTQRLTGPEAPGPRDQSPPAGFGGSSAKDPRWPPALPDSIAGQLVFRLAPRSWHPLLQLARLDRPIGWWLLLLPCWWSSALASIYQGGPLRVRDLLLFFIGAIVMRGAGATYNDIIDRDIDAKVERTKRRPLASGRIGATTAVLFLAAQCLAGLALLLMFNGFTILLGFASLGVVGLYPFMKRNQLLATSCSGSGLRMGGFSWVGGSPGVARAGAAIALSRRGLLDHRL